MIYCISLFSLHQQLLALPTGVRLRSDRWGLLKVIEQLSSAENAAAGTTTGPPDSAHFSLLEAKRDWWKQRLMRGPPPKRDGPAPATLTDVLQALPSPRGSRSRRHAHNGAKGHHHKHPPQLMRVGCVLGTCQVQNLSHRLYQLIGQKGLEDSSPMNPKSPHSYG